MKTPRKRTVTYNSARRSRTFIPDNEDVFDTPQIPHAATAPTTLGGEGTREATGETLKEPEQTPIQNPKTPTTKTPAMKTPSKSTPANKTPRRKTPKKSRLKIFDSEEEEEPEEPEDETQVPLKKTPKKTPRNTAKSTDSAQKTRTPRTRAPKKSPLQIFEHVDDDDEEDFARSAGKGRQAKKGFVKKGEGRAPKRRKKAVASAPDVGEDGGNTEADGMERRRGRPDLLNDDGNAAEQTDHEAEPVDDLEAILSEAPVEPFVDSSDSDIYVPETHKKRRKKHPAPSASRPPISKPTRRAKNPAPNPAPQPSAAPSESPPKPSYLTLRRVLASPAAPTSNRRPKRNRFKWLPTLTSSLPPPPPSRRRAVTLYDALAGRANYEGFIKSSYYNEYGEIAHRSQKVQPADQVLGRRRRFPPQFEGVEGLVRADEAAAETPKGKGSGTGKGKKVLPDGELLGALHQYVADLYKAEGLGDRGSYIFDETALVAVGVLVEERVKRLLGDRGHWALIDRDERWGSDEGEEEDEKAGKVGESGENGEMGEVGEGDGGDVVVVEASETGEEESEESEDSDTE